MMLVDVLWLKYKIDGLLRRLRVPSGHLQDKLLAEGKTRWLDIGSSRFDEGFICMNLHSSESLKPELVERYHRANVLDLQGADYEKLGKFDLVRMQHVFEHFSFEEGELVLKQCSRFLNPDGYLLMTVPDLRLHVKSYLSGYRQMPRFVDFACQRVPKDAPPSFIFSVHVHQSGHGPNEVPGDAHKWCYDVEGLMYQMNKVNEFKNIRKLHLLHPLAEVPFTHNRPFEDLCLIAQKR